MRQGPQLPCGLHDVGYMMSGVKSGIIIVTEKVLWCLELGKQ